MTTLLVIGLSAGCAGTISAAEKQQVELHGSASYRQRMMLPLDADFTAWLLPMEEEEPLAEMRLPHAGQPPIEFTLRLPSGATVPARLRLEITGLDRLLFVLDQTVDTGAWAAAGHRKFLLEMPPQE